MRIRASICCIAAFAFSLAANEGRAQSGVIFANSGGNWAEPWYGVLSSNSSLLYMSAYYFCDSGPELVGNGRLEGLGYSAELWGGPEGSDYWGLQFLARVPYFREGIGAGLFYYGEVPVPFAQPGQRVALQVRVYDNRGATSWEQVVQCFCTMVAVSTVFTSEPLGDTPVTLRGMGSYCLTPVGTAFGLSVPVLSLSTGEIRDYRGTPSLVSIYAPLSPSHSVVAGDTVTLKVEVPNPASSVTWRYNGVDLPGQTNQSLVLSNIQPGQSGLYSARTTAISTYGAATNSIRVEVVPRPILEKPARDLRGTFTAQLHGLTNRSVAIESSTNLQTWVRGPVQWVGGRFSCKGDTVTNAPLFGKQLFYRAVVLP